ncbi:MAG TPA: lysylphosphatidylglycerol synthase transmembrane domain-containing protein [Candidatus Sulfotelmatobacter sp.]|nr:lysylphosphatidylglycerol synthase transmembrane domain-containing protein [Candidatus Sulfotelmatobacter sp.]
MDKKRILASLVVFCILAILVYLQYREWHSFDWGAFWRQTQRIKWLRVVRGVALIYFGYILRAVRWKLFLQPTRPSAKTVGLISPTLIGFTGLALLGRAGEPIRPYLIARRENLTLSSQLAVWAVERIFDVGAFTFLIGLAVFREGGLSSIPEPSWYADLQRGVLILIGLVSAIVVAALVINRKGEAVARWVEKEFSHLSANLGYRMARWIREFGNGLNTIHGPVSFFWLAAVSVGMWYVIALAYKEVTHAYGAASLEIPTLQILILMGSSMLGSMLQLPAVGGGSQLATIKTLSGLFAVPPELAASCGILLWLVTFAAVVPSGLILAHHERLSLRKLSVESHHAEQSDDAKTPVA